MTQTPLSSQKVKGQLAGGGGILWRPPAQLVLNVVGTIQIVFGNDDDGVLASEG